MRTHAECFGKGLIDFQTVLSLLLRLQINLKRACILVKSHILYSMVPGKDYNLSAPLL